MCVFNHLVYFPDGKYTRYVICGTIEPTIADFISGGWRVPGAEAKEIAAFVMDMQAGIIAAKSLRAFRGCSIALVERWRI
jgi:hypothetical protein